MIRVEDCCSIFTIGAAKELQVCLLHYQRQRDLPGETVELLTKVVIPVETGMTTFE